MYYNFLHVSIKGKNEKEKVYLSDKTNQISSSQVVLLLQFLCFFMSYKRQLISPCQAN